MTISCILYSSNYLDSTEVVGSDRIPYIFYWWFGFSIFFSFIVKALFALHFVVIVLSLLTSIAFSCEHTKILLFFLLLLHLFYTILLLYLWLLFYSKDVQNLSYFERRQVCIFYSSNSNRKMWWEKRSK